jgi:hypothetical protein
MRISKKFAKKQIGKLIYVPKPNSFRNSKFPEQSRLKILEAAYIASNPFDSTDDSESRCESEEQCPQANTTDRECVTDASSVSGSEDTTTYGFDHDDDLCGDFCSDAAFFENEVEEWRDVLTYYFTHNEASLPCRE